MENIAPQDNSRWTGQKASSFLKLLARGGKVAPAARAVGMSRQSAYRLRARAPKFAQLWDLAMAQAERTRAAARSTRKNVHPLLAKGVPNMPPTMPPTMPPVPDQRANVSPKGDIASQDASHIARVRSHRAQAR